MSTVETERIAQLETQAQWMGDLFRLSLRLFEGDDPVLPVIVGEAARILDVPMVTVDVIQRGQVFAKASTGLPPELAVGGKWNAEDTLSARVIEADKPLLVHDADQHDELKGLKIVVDGGIKAYLGVPVRRQDGRVLAALAAMSSEPMAFHGVASELLTILSEWVGAELERQSYDHELRDLKEKFRRMSIMDELTGVFNRDHFMEQLGKELKRAKRYGSRFCLLMFDVDRFKLVNDAQGTELGDLVLREVAVILKGAVRDVDLVARYAGEEFAIIMPETDEESGYLAAERVCAMVREHSFADDRRPVNLTVSGGIAAYPPETHSTVDILIDRADEALFNAKRDGGDRVGRV